MGENHPSTSKVFAMSDTSALLVTSFSRGGNQAPVQNFYYINGILVMLQYSNTLNSSSVSLNLFATSEPGFFYLFCIK